MLDKEQKLIDQFKNFLSQPVLIDHARIGCAAAHGLLGAAARAQIHKILARRLESFDSHGAAEQIRRGRKYQQALITKARHPHLAGPIRAGLEMYLAALSAWAEGAQLGAFQNKLIAAALDDTPLTALDLAFLLQEDEVGCQTGTYRDRDGAIILWHSEEDYEEQPGQRFDQLRLFSFRAYNHRVATAFIYPDLLPGPAFAWQAGHFIQAVDSLHPRAVDLPGAILPNTLAWLSLYLGPSVPREELVRALSPAAGGYSMTALSRTEDKVSVEKIEFANDQYHVSHLDQPAGCYLFQTNIVADTSLAVAAEEKTRPSSRAYNERRIARTEAQLRLIQKSDDPLGAIFQMLRSRGDDGAYSNHDVKGYLVGHVHADRFTLWVGSGPAMDSDELMTLECE